MKSVVRVLASLLCSALMASGQQRATEPTPAAIASTLRKLQQVKLVDDMGYEVPPAAIPLLITVKHQLRGLFQNVLTSTGPDAGARGIGVDLVKRLEIAGVKLSDPVQSEPYGHIITLSGGQPEGHPDLFLFKVDLSIPCGDDNALYVFQRNGSDWKLLIALESNGYNEVKGGLGNLQYGLSPLDEQGNWFLVYAHDLPWCTSAWNGVTYSAVRPGKIPDHFQEIITRNEGMYLGGDRGLDLKVTRDGFGLTFEGSHGLDTTLLTREHMVSYRVQGNAVTRVAPIASSPDGFLDEWRNLPWSDAARFSLAPNADTRQWHAKLKKLGSSEVKFVQPCPGPNRWQVGLEAEIGQPAQATEIFAEVVKKGQAYLLRSIDDKRTAGCPGETKPEGER